MNNKINKAVFIDRDGTINIDDKEVTLSNGKKVKGYIHKIEQWQYLPNAIDGLKKLSEAGYKIIIITNQSGIGRGYFTEEHLSVLHKYILNNLKKYGIHIDGIYYCPHFIGGIEKYNLDCNCRKPKIGMILKAAEKYHIYLEESYCIGDKTVDIKLGKDAHCKTILVKTGKAGNDKEYDIKPDFTVQDLKEAAEIIIMNE